MPFLIHFRRFFVNIKNQRDQRVTIFFLIFRLVSAFETKYNMCRITQQHKINVFQY